MDANTNGPTNERHIDALGKPVEIDKTYGYSSSDGSFITVVVGTAKRLTAKKVTLEVISRRFFLYGEQTHRSWGACSATVSVHGSHLFPVDVRDPKEANASFWQMLSECETKADNDNDNLLKYQVEGWYREWNMKTGDNLAPVWVARGEVHRK